MEVKNREAQECNREVAFEGSVYQRCEPMNKKRMRRKRGTSELVITKSISIKGAKRIFAGCAPKVAELTSGDLPFVRESGLRRAEVNLTERQKSAEGVVSERRRPEWFSVKEYKKGAVSKPA